MMRYSFLVCPTCQVQLVEEDGWRCPHCGGCWREREGIPVFKRDEEHYWGEIPQPEMAELLKLAAGTFWHRAIEERLYPKERGLWEYITSLSRAEGLLFVPLDQTDWVLDYGAGWGTLSVALAPWVRAVVALDGTWERARFLQLRAMQEGLTNVYPLWAGDMLPLPLPSEKFSLAVLNGVLEWVPQSFPKLSPLEAQRRLLQELWRLLRPGGMLYLGIENRYGFPFFLGKTAHGDLPFASVLPRWLSDALSRSLRGEPYRTWTHSLRAYKRLLQSVGFSSVQFYWPYPSYVRPEFLIPLEERAPLEFFLRWVWRGSSLSRRLRFWAVRLAHLGGIWKYLVPTFVILASKEGS